MMYLDNLILTMKDEDGVIINRHFNEVYVSIKATEMTVSNRTKDIVTYELTDVLYMQSQGHPRHWRLFV